MSIDTYFKEGEHYYVSKESCSVNLFEKSSAKARKRNANFCWNEKVVGLLCKVFKKKRQFRMSKMAIEQLIKRKEFFS
jgi:hypothetical protein